MVNRTSLTLRKDILDEMKRKRRATERLTGRKISWDDFISGLISGLPS